MRLKNFLNEQTPYDGSHIGHTSSLEKIKQAYGNTYQVDQNQGMWYVYAKVAGQWVPVTSPFKDRNMANKFLAWLKSAETQQKGMIDTIGKNDSGKGPERYPMKEGKKKVNEAKKPAKGTLYIKWSSVFDSPANKYDIKLFSKTLKDGGAKKVWSEASWGWDNQPDVVLFTGLKERDAQSILSQLPVFKKWGAIIHDASEDWE